MSTRYFNFWGRLLLTSFKCMPLVVAQRVADGQILSVAVAAFAQRLNVFKRCGLWQNMRTAHPAGHHAMQLSGDGFINLAAGVCQPAQCISRSFVNAKAKRRQYKRMAGEAEKVHG